MRRSSVLDSYAEAVGKDRREVQELVAIDNGTAQGVMSG